MLVLTYMVSIAIMHNSKSSTVLSKECQILVVTAHPDDECMFFSPTISHIVSTNKYKPSILVLSDGGYDGLGPMRHKEMIKAA